MGKRLLSRSKNRSPRKRQKLSSQSRTKDFPDTVTRSGTVSVAELFTKQRQSKTAKSKDDTKEGASFEIIDISDSPQKQPNDHGDAPSTSPYFKKVEPCRTSSTPVRKNRLTLKRNCESEPVPVKDSGDVTDCTAEETKATVEAVKVKDDSSSLDQCVQTKSSNCEQTNASCKEQKPKSSANQEKVTVTAGTAAASTAGENACGIEPQFRFYCGASAR